MEKEFVPYPLALRLKELGFNEPCLARYLILTFWERVTGEIKLQMTDCTINEEYLIKAPTYSQAFRFFREKYDILHNIFFIEIENVNKFSASLKTVYDKKWTHLGFIENVNTYEEAELECLKKLIEIVKKRNDEKVQTY